MSDDEAYRSLGKQYSVLQNYMFDLKSELAAAIAQRDKLAVALDTRENLNAMVLCHEQQIKDIAAHLLELKRLVTPMMEFKRREWVETNNAVCALLKQAHDVLALSSLAPRREWVGLTLAECEEIQNDYAAAISKHVFNAIEAKLKDKNT